MKIFLTGGTGFIGKKFIQEALKKNHVIYAVTRRKFKKKQRNLYWLKGSIDKQAWSKYLKKSDVLVHMAAAGVNSKVSLKEAKNINVIKPFKLLINALNSNCNKWLIIGSASEYGIQARQNKKLSNKTIELPETIYEKTKYSFSYLCLYLSKQHNTKCRILRLFNIYGEGENEKRLWPSIKKAAEKNLNLKMTNGKELRDFMSVEEAAKKILQACNFKIRNKSFPQIWHLASGKPISVKKFALNLWKKYNAKGKIFFGKIDTKSNKNYISEKNSIWF